MGSLTRKCGLLTVALLIMGAVMASDKTLLNAVSDGELDRVQQLISEGADLNVQALDGSSALLLATADNRVEIARALAAEPRFILLDEPFAGVDPISVIDIKKIIQHLKDRGLGVLITDHNVRETLDVCEKAYIVSHGKMIAEGAPAEILADEQVKRVYLGDQFSL